MRPPRFWFRSPDRPGFFAGLLSPLAWAYAAAGKRRASRTGERASVPVICVGNLNAGGTGKTPTVIALLEYLAARGIKAHALSRGYGGNQSGPVLVDPARHAAAEVGDEPLLVAAFAPGWVARDRVAGARAAVDAGAGAVVLDDGFQDPGLEKELSILVVDAGQGFGNGRVIPAGPLREPVSEGLKRADIVLVIGSDDENRKLHGTWPELAGKPVIEGKLVPLLTGMDWKGARVLAFAGIGRPEKFFQTLRELGAEIVQKHALADHAPLGEALLKRLQAEAKARSAQLVTTEKDSVRLPKAWNARVLTLPVRLEVDDWAVLEGKLADLGL